MVKHIVLYRLLDTSPQSIQKTTDVLLSMRGRVQSIVEMEVGADFLHSERSYDLALIVTFENKAQMDAYQQDPYHNEVVKPHMHAARSASVALDYEY